MYHVLCKCLLFFPTHLLQRPLLCLLSVKFIPLDYKQLLFKIIKSCQWLFNNCMEAFKYFSNLYSCLAHANSALASNSFLPFTYQDFFYQTVPSLEWNLSVLRELFNLIWIHQKLAIYFKTNPTEPGLVIIFHRSHSRGSTAPGQVKRCYLCVLCASDFLNISTWRGWIVVSSCSRGIQGKVFPE